MNCLINEIVPFEHHDPDKSDYQVADERMKNNHFQNYKSAKSLYFQLRR